MTYEICEKRSAHTYVACPVFTPEGKSGREKKNAARMNRFYETMMSAAVGYASGENFPSGGNYTCRCSVTAGESIRVETVVRMKNRAKTVFSASMTHLWRDGVICPSVTKNVECAKIAQSSVND